MWYGIYMEYKDLFKPSKIKELLEIIEAKPLKSLGQNFIVQESLVDKIIESADIKESDHIIEIGPGLGVLTEKILQKTKNFTAYEKDKKYAQYLQKKYPNIIHQDILKVKDFPKDFKIVANIPFNITGAIIKKFLEIKNPPKMYLLMQKEVAQRIIRKEPDMTILSASVWLFAEPKILFYISKDNFWPQPRVDTCVLEIIPKRSFDKKFIKTFFIILKNGFSSPRKQIQNNLSSLKSREEVLEWLIKNNIDPKQRPETLSINNWISLAKTF